MMTKELDRQYLGRSGNPRDLEVVSAKGSYVFDPRGKKYLDFFTGWCVGNIGWKIKTVDQEIAKFKGPHYVSPGYLYRPWAELAEKIVKLLPGNFGKIHRATGGTEAVEIALQAAMAHTGRKEFISIEGSYHGHSLGAMSVGSSGFRKRYQNLLPGCHKIKPPLNRRAALEIINILKSGKIAAYISEPVICNLGLVIPTAEYFEIVQKACKKYGALLIADEVATGFGRTGKMFAYEHYKLKPDLVCLAKGLTGGYGVLAATAMTDSVAKSFRFGFSFYSTFGWQPLNVAATLANLNYWQKNKTRLLTNANQMGNFLARQLKALDFKNQPQIRQIGLAITLEFSNASYASSIIKSALAKGLLLADAEENQIVMFPSLNLTLAEAKEGLSILKQCL